MTPATPPSRLRVRDSLGVAVASLRSRRLRVALTSSGIAIGIAAMVAVLGLSTSSRADLLATLDRLGTDVLTVEAGQSYLGVETPLAGSAPGAIRRITAVEQAAAIVPVDASVRRTDRVPAAQTGGIRVAAAEPALLDTLRVGLAAGRFFDTASAEHPTVALGARAAARLGVDGLDDRPMVWLGGRWFTVVGVLEPALLAPELDSTALIGLPAVSTVLDVEPPIEPTKVYVRTKQDTLDDVRDLLPATANPRSPEAVRVSRPSDALAARAAADTTFTTLLLGLGAVALLVGGIGIANVMVIAVLERRHEIGLRRALGATRRHIRIQFLLEAVALSSAGGVLGVLLGAGITAIYAASRGWTFELPMAALAAASALAVLVGALAGLYPASRAARLQPADAIRPE